MVVFPGSSQDCAVHHSLSVMYSDVLCTHVNVTRMGRREHTLACGMVFGQFTNKAGGIPTHPPLIRALLINLNIMLSVRKIIFDLWLQREQLQGHTFGHVTTITSALKAETFLSHNLICNNG